MSVTPLSYDQTEYPTLEKMRLQTGFSIQEGIRRANLVYIDFSKNREASAEESRRFVRSLPKTLSDKDFGFDF